MMNIRSFWILPVCFIMSAGSACTQEVATNSQVPSGVQPRGNFVPGYGSPVGENEGSRHFENGRLQVEILHYDRALARQHPEASLGSTKFSVDCVGRDYDIIRRVFYDVNGNVVSEMPLQGTSADVRGIHWAVLLPVCISFQEGKPMDGPEFRDIREFLELSEEMEADRESGPPPEVVRR